MRMTERERPLWEAGALVGGVDEAGRGPLAGPVVAACVVMPPEPLLPDINDSKKVAEKKREALCEEILRCAVSVGVGVASVEEIECLNIKQAARLAMKRAIELAKPARVFVDAERGLDVSVPQEGIVHGDAVSYSIAAASIVAKVTRDRDDAGAGRAVPAVRLCPAQGIRNPGPLRGPARLRPLPRAPQALHPLGLCAEMSAHGDRGAMGERAARAYLEARGLRFVGANLRVGRDEVDLLMREGETLVFVEVKLRKDRDDAPFAVDAAKQRRISRAGRRLSSGAWPVGPACAV